MANETTIVANLYASKGGAAVNPGSTTKQLTMAGAGMGSSVVALTTASTLLTIPGVSGVAGVIKFINMDATNNVLISGETGFTAVMQLVIRPGVPLIVSLISNTLYAKMSASTGNLFIEAVDQ